MLQQTQVKTVIPYWERWMRELRTIQAAAKAKRDKIHKLWEGLGYYSRARNLQKAAKQIMEKHDGKFPDNFDDVLALPGIGRYTAGAICSIAFNQPTPILDGNVIRVLTRIFGIAENPKEKKANARLWKHAEKLVTSAACFNSVRSNRHEEAQTSKSEIGNRKSEISQSLLTSAATIAGNCSALNQSLMELGALVCAPRNPQCRICPARKHCVAFRDDRVEEFPNFGKRTSATARQFVAFVIERNGKFLVRQRPAGVVNAHLWEFPNFEADGNRTGAGKGFKSEFGFVPSELSPLFTVKHSITRYRITLNAFAVKLNRFTAKHDGIWKTPAQMRALAFSSAHKQILAKLTGALK